MNSFIMCKCCATSSAVIGDRMRRLFFAVGCIFCAPCSQAFYPSGTGSISSLFSSHAPPRSNSATTVSSRALASKISRKEAVTTMAAAAIVGGGRIGSALHDMGGGADTLIGRTDAIPEGEGPIYVCTRNDDLEDVISRTPPSRREDLVFLQNSVLGPLLEKHGLAKNTQVLVYFAVSKMGETPIDGVTDANPEGLTSACGKWSGEFKERLAGQGLTCHVLPEDRYTARMYEKHMWICAFMLSGAAHKCNMGQVDADHGDEFVGKPQRIFVGCRYSNDSDNCHRNGEDLGPIEVRALIGEMQAAIEGEYGVTFEGGVQDRLCAYARSVAHYPAAVKEFSWRNGFFWEISEKARGEGKEDPCPLHSKLLREVAEEQGLSL